LAVSERVKHRGEFLDNTPVPLAEPLGKEYTEIGKVVRFNFRENVIGRRGEKAFPDWDGAHAAFFAVRAWLNDYPYRVKVGLEVFLIAALATLTIALATIIYQDLKAAVADPTRSLRYE